MKVLFTGASSFTGYWFIKELVEKGHEVVAICRQKYEDYSGTRKERVKEILKLCSVHDACVFGSENFLRIIQQSQWDLFCHHAADVANYKSLDFNFLDALGNNTFNLSCVLNALQKRGCRKILLTGTVFEQDEGAGSHREAVYPYALSKGLTYQVFRYYAKKLGIDLGKFVIPNPFGPYEEYRFTSFLVHSWFSGKTACIATPDYIRDNIHVDLLAKAYRNFAEMLFTSSGCEKFFRPSGYVERQGDFARRFADNLSQRLAIPCQIEMKEQVEFQEPRMRVNTDSLCGVEHGWSEKEAWDRLATYYLNTSLIKC